jgi:hypothetical protein
MFIRLKFPVTIDSNVTFNYMVLHNFQFSRSAHYDAYELSQLFGQNPKLMMLMGSTMTFSISGSLFVKTTASNAYYAEGLYNSSFGIMAFASLPLLINHFNRIMKSWNDGKNNLKTDGFVIEYVNTYNESSPYATENYLPETFTYSIASRDVFVINVTLSGKIGDAMFRGGT